MPPSLSLPGEPTLEGINYQEILATYAAHDERGLAVIGPDRSILAMNQAAREMIDYRGPLPAAAGAVVPDPNFEYAVGEAFHGRRELWHESYLPLPDRLLRFHLIPVARPDHPAALILSTVENVTKVRHLETVRRDFVANVSHELRTPLASIHLLVETLQHGAIEDPGAGKHFLQRIQVEVASMSRLVEELLELSRLESGTLTLELRPIDLPRLLSEVRNRLAPIAREKSIALTVDSQQPLPPLLADGNRLEQVLMNLAHNAIKFTPPGGTVTLRARRRGRGVQLEVIDTGPGLDSADAARVFERFYKVDKGRNRDGGAGLGLAIARHLIELHGSKLQVVSEPGQGARFYFSLPAA